MKRADLGDYLIYEGKMCEVVAVSEGKMLHLRPVVADACAHCGHTERISVLENAPIFQEGAKPVPTITYPRQRKCLTPAPPARNQTASETATRHSASN